MNSIPLILKPFCLILALALSSASLFAEERQGKPPKPDLSELYAQLQLSDEQQSEFSQILKKHHQQRRGANKDLRKQHRSEIAGVLNEEQMEIFKNFMKAHRPPRHKKDRGKQ